MKTRNGLIRVAVGCLAGCLLSLAWADDPTVSGVTTRQRWPWNPLVDIEYTLTCDDTQRVDIAVAGYNGATALSLPGESLSGDLFRLSNGTHRIVWNPSKTVYTNSGALTKFSVGLTPTVAPVYMIIDLTKNAGDAEQTVTITEADLASGAYGAVQTNPVTGVQSVIWTEVTNHVEYMTTKMVLRRVPSGAFSMGGSMPVTLTKDYYIGVFEVTQAQWTNVMGGSWWPNTFYTNAAYRATRPAETLSYNDVRGATNDTPAVNWPLTGPSVTPASFMGKLRVKAGTETFDLPTDAQWEYACRAGTTTLFNDGKASNINAPENITNQWLNALGRYKYNGGKINNGADDPPRDCTTANGTAAVGSYQPNAWGLYDMHGNNLELCLDWYATISGGTDPSGPESGVKRIRRGGSWAHDPGNCTSNNRLDIDPTSRNNWLGFRIVKTLP